MKPNATSKILLLICLVGCRPTNIATPSLTALQSEKIIKVSLQDVLKNKATYQGQFIETEGFYKRAFEESAIYYPITLPLGDTVIKGELIKSTGDEIARGRLALWDGLWIDWHSKNKKAADKLKNKLVKVRGYFDTTAKGHLGSFAAELKNTYLVQPVY